MKINPGSSGVINIVKQEQKLEKKTEETKSQKITDNITLENRRASSSQVENVEQAKTMLSSVINGMQTHSSDLYNANIQRAVNLVQ